MFRRVFHYPFWKIDRFDKRWDWDVTKATFNPSQIEEKEANRFLNFWRKSLFDNVIPTEDEGFIYEPLQGRLLDHRSFQSCSPNQMIERTLSTIPDRKIIITLHSKESYSRQEFDTVERLEHTYPNFELRLIQMDALLDFCALVVTQNSSAAFNGYFFGKRTVLFGKN